MKNTVLAICALAVSALHALVVPSFCENALKRALDSDASWVMEKKLPGSSKTLVATGIVSCAANSGIVWQVRHPFCSSLRMTKTEMEIDDGETRTVRKLAEYPRYDCIRKSCDAFLAGDDKAFDGFFDVETSVEADGSWKLALKPSAIGLRRMLGTFEIFGSNVVTKVVMRSKTGGESVIRFTETATSGHSLWKDK